MIDIPYRTQIIIPEFRIYRDTDIQELKDLIRSDYLRIEEVNLKIENHCLQLMNYKRQLSQFTGVS
ncbi:MAG: hypothetical protein ACRC1D_10150 [Culicoidibacterales bacterium]